MEGITVCDDCESGTSDIVQERIFQAFHNLRGRVNARLLTLQALFDKELGEKGGLRFFMRVLLEDNRMRREWNRVERMIADSPMNVRVMLKEVKETNNNLGAHFLLVPNTGDEMKDKSLSDFICDYLKVFKNVNVNKEE